MTADQTDSPQYGQGKFAEMMALRNEDADTIRRIALCQEAIDLGLSPEEQVLATAYLGIDRLEVGEVGAGVAAIEAAVTLDSALPQHVFHDPATRGTFFPSLQLALLKQLEDLKEREGSQAVAPFVTERLKIFDYLPTRTMPGLYVELGASYAKAGEPGEARKAFKKAMDAEAFEEVDRAAIQIASANLDRLDRAVRLRRGGNVLIAVVGFISVVSVLAWMAGWLPQVLPYVALAIVIYYPGRHAYRLIASYGWQSRTLCVLLAAVLPGLLATLLLSLTARVRDTPLLILLGLALVAVSCSAGLEYWAYARHRGRSAGTPHFAELGGEVRQHGQTVLRALRSGVTRIRRAFGE